MTITRIYARQLPRAAGRLPRRSTRLTSTPLMDRLSPSPATASFTPLPARCSPRVSRGVWSSGLTARAATDWPVTLNALHAGRSRRPPPEASAKSGMWRKTSSVCVPGRSARGPPDAMMHRTNRSRLRRPGHVHGKWLSRRACRTAWPWGHAAIHYQCPLSPDFRPLLGVKRS